MKILLRKWRGLQIAAAMTAAILPLHGAQVKTLGGGPNNSGFSRSGFVNGNTLLNAKFFNPYGLAQDQNGNLFVADRANNMVRRISRPGAADSMTSTFKSGLFSPVGVAVDGSNNVYVLTQGDGKLRKYSNTGRLLRTVGRLSSPTALAVGTNFAVYVVELGGSLKKIPLSGPTQLLGPGGFNSPRGITVLPDGRLAVSTVRNHALYLVDQNTGAATLLAGGNGAGFNDGPGGLAQFNAPHGLATAPNGMIVLADRNNHRVRLISTNGTVSTIFGVSRSQWTSSYGGWSDGDSSVAAIRSPVGVAVGRDGTVYDTEVYWHLIRQATGLALQSTGGSGAVTNIVGTNIFVGTNVISFGFPSGEGSSEFVGAAGQSFYAPVTLALAPGQEMYSLQFGITATNETATPFDASTARFESMLLQPGGVVITFDILSGTFKTNVTYISINQNYQFQDNAANLLGVGWIEKYLHTNLYNTLNHHLVKYSQAKDHRFVAEEVNKAIVGAYRVVIPATATEADTFRIKLSNASATPKDWTENVPLRSPTDGSLGAGAMNVVKRITVGSRPYIVGDTVPFRWYNAGDFGEGTLLNNDVIQVFESALTIYEVNYPILDSDLFDALDASDGTSTNALFQVDDLSINSKTVGDGLLAVDDVFVTFRRSLDPTLKWFARYWSNGVRHVVEVPNALSLGFDVAPKAVLVQPAADAPAVRPSVALSLNDALTTPNVTLQFPVHADVLGGHPLRVMMLSLTVEALDGSPALTTPIQFQTAPGFQAPELSRTRSAAHYAAVWLTNGVIGFSGSGTLALLHVTIPANAGSGAAYRVHFNHFSGSPNGTDLFATHTSDALILLSDRSGSTWGDGISDAWRLRWFGSIFSSDGAAGGDPDGDGVINSIESANGTDPTNALSY